MKLKGTMLRGLNHPTGTRLTQRAFQRCRLNSIRDRQKSTSSAGDSFTGMSPGRTAAYCVFGGFVGSTVLAVNYVRDQVGDTEGLMRTLNFYSLAIPTYARYRLLQIRKAPYEEWDALDHEASKEGLEKILELRGFYIKSGQMAAANIGNAFPEVWQNTMSVLQDNCPSKSFSEIKDIINDQYKSEFGKSLDEIFEWLDPNPIGAASIGQVHRARLRSTGKDVVVKVQYPEIEKLFRGDIRTLIMFCKVAQPVHVPALEEIENQFMTEFDYREEAKQLDKARFNMIKADFSSICEVPKSHPDLCTKLVLVMDYLDGEKLPDALKRDLEKNAFWLGKTPEELRIEHKQKLKEAAEKKIDLMGPSTEEFDRYISFLNGRRFAENLKAVLHNISIAWWYPGSQRREYRAKNALPINHSKLVDTLLYIHGHQVLVDGYFNGDCHPGNILLMDNNRLRGQLPYKLGLIDYGQVKQLTKDQRLLMCKLIIALANEDIEKVAELTAKTGYRSKYMDKDNTYLYSKISFDEDNNKITNGVHIQEFLESLDETDPVENLAKDFIMISRVTILLRGLAHALLQGRSVAKAWKPIAERVLKEEDA